MESFLLGKKGMNKWESFNTEPKDDEVEKMFGENLKAQSRHATPPGIIEMSCLVIYIVTVFTR